jgi:hypothetical protein
MSKVTFYPLGNADSCLIRLDNDMLFVFDYADMHNPDDPEDKRMPLRAAFDEDIGWPKRKYVDVLAFTHGDDDHVCKAPERFWLEHATKYQGEDRIKINELWVPASLIVEEGCDDCTRIIRQEARFRFLNKQRIKVFARPEHLKDWVDAQGKRFEDYQHLIVDAGRTVPGLTLESHGIEFFVHSPFAERTSDSLLDRNDNCLVMQATIRTGGINTRFLITADSVSEVWQKMVNITRTHHNEHRLAWDLFKIPHHCSYLSMAAEKGKVKTEPTPEFAWLLKQGTERSVMVSSSWPIPSTTESQPPHVETYRTYKDTADELDADLVVTMENPTKSKPKRTIINITGSGVSLEKAALTAASVITASRSPRVG